MKLNKQAVNLTVVLILLTFAVDSWVHGLNNITLSITVLLILGGLAELLTAKFAALQPRSVLLKAVDNR